MQKLLIFKLLDIRSYCRPPQGRLVFYTRGHAPQQATATVGLTSCLRTKRCWCLVHIWMMIWLTHSWRPWRWLACSYPPSSALGEKHSIVVSSDDSSTPLPYTINTNQDHCLDTDHGIVFVIHAIVFPVPPRHTAT